MDNVKERFDRDGFVLVDGLFTDEEIDRLRTEMDHIVEEMDPTDHPRSIFTTTDEKKHAADDYFLNSSDKIRYFYEEGAFDAEGKLTTSKDRALNKIGHALHWLSPAFKEFTFSNKLKELVRAVGYSQPAVVQSMYIFKQPNIGGEVTPHYDATFLYVDPIEHLLGVWIAVDDATEENGCLWFIPGSHKVDRVSHRFVRTHAKGGENLLKFTGEKPTFDETKFIPVPVKKGSVVLIHGLVWHKSEANKSDKSRHAYTFHVVERSDTEWSKDNWLQETPSYKFPQLFQN
uniref:Phytanoyl-CoA dioxygenase n=1 Tax=Plectus sambesii TaxID=2011161 RepID=A0A914W8U7_9BILA